MKHRAGPARALLTQPRCASYTIDPRGAANRMRSSRNWTLSPPTDFRASSISLAHRRPGRRCGFRGYAGRSASAMKRSISPAHSGCLPTVR